MRASWQAAAVAVGAIGCALLPADTGADTTRQTASVDLTTTRPGASTGSTIRLHIRNPGDAGAKPYSVKTIVFTSAPGTVIDTRALPQCKASDAELMAAGGAACPADTRVNTGLVRSDTGSSFGVPRYVNSDIQNFNNQGELVGVSDTREFPYRNVTHSKISGTSVTFDVPDAPGQGPPDNFSAVTDLTILTPALARGGRAYLRTPPACPASGFWRGSVDFIYHDGVRQSVETRAPCQGGGARRGDHTRPRIGVRGLPRRGRCARARLRVRARASDASGIGRLAMYRDGRLVGNARRATLSRRVRVGRGRHRVTVLARDRAGNRARKSRVLRRCARR
jgi:hypothetical protein